MSGRALTLTGRRSEAVMFGGVSSAAVRVAGRVEVLAGELADRIRRKSGVPPTPRPPAPSVEEPSEDIPPVLVPGG